MYVDEQNHLITAWHQLGENGVILRNGLTRSISKPGPKPEKCKGSDEKDHY